MKHSWKWIWAVGFLTASTTAHAQNWGGLLDRVGEHLAKTIEDRMDKSSDKLAGKAFDGVDTAVDTPPDGGTAAAKCVATDVACLKDAQAHAKRVEIVSEEELDTLRCSATDANCLQRAKTLGKKVEITD